jgi:sugar phosphate isomerase/epimerase
MTGNLADKAAEKPMSDLICSYYTLAGESPFAGGPCPRPFEDRVRACAEAGYSGLGIHIRDYRAMREAGANQDDLEAIVRDHGMRHVEVEFLLNWFADGTAGAVARRDEHTLFQMAETFGARVMVLGGDMAGGNPLPFDELIERFASLCGRAADRGVTIGVEPCAWTNIGTVDEALRLISGSAARNAGLYLDVWHLYRRDFDYDRLRDIDPSMIVGAQLGDATADVHGSLIEDCLGNRLLPGEGAAGTADFVSVLNDMGVAVPLSVEVISDVQRGRPLDEAAQVSYRAARRVLDQAGTGRRLSPP